jgi:hypothetical protein
MILLELQLKLFKLLLLLLIDLLIMDEVSMARDKERNIAEEEI